MFNLSRYEVLGDEAHVNLRTFRDDGSAVDTPVWFHCHDGHYFLRTVRSSAKVKRLRASPRVQLAPCRWNGELIGVWRWGNATLLDDTDPRLTDINAQMNEKYGDYRREMTELMASLNKTLCYIEITLN